MSSLQLKKPVVPFGSKLMSHTKSVFRLRPTKTNHIKREGDWGVVRDDQSFTVIALWEVLAAQSDGSLKQATAEQDRKQLKLQQNGWIC